MPENFERFNRSWESHEVELKRLVEGAEKEAPTEEEADAYQNSIDRLNRELLEGGITHDQFGAATAKLEQPGGHVSVDTLPEYRAVLEFAGFSQQEIADTLAHENDHMLLAREIPGATLKYRLQFMKTESGIAMRPSVRIDWPEGVQDEGIRARLKDALIAPEHLSDADKRALGEE